MGVGGRGLGGRDVGECLGHFRRVRSSRLDQPGRPGQATSRDVTLPSRVKPPLLATPSKTSVMRYHQYIDSEFWISEGFVVHFTTVESYCDHTSFAPLQGLHYRSRIKVPGLLIAQEREPSIFFNISRSDSQEWCLCPRRRRPTSTAFHRISCRHSHATLSRLVDPHAYQHPSAKHSRSVVLALFMYASTHELTCEGRLRLVLLLFLIGVVVAVLAVLPMLVVALRCSFDF
jgi:hypothetical protein